MRPSEVLHQTPEGTRDGFPNRLPFLVLKAFPPAPLIPNLQTASHLYGPGGLGSAGHVFRPASPNAFRSHSGDPKRVSTQILAEKLPPPLMSAVIPTRRG